MGFPGGSDSKEFARNEGDPSSIPGSGRSPGEGNGNPLQYSCLENPVDRGARCPTFLQPTGLQRVTQLQGATNSFFLPLATPHWTQLQLQRASGYSERNQNRELIWKLNGTGSMINTDQFTDLVIRSDLVNCTSLSWIVIPTNQAVGIEMHNRKEVFLNLGFSLPFLFINFSFYIQKRIMNHVFKKKQQQR